MLRRMRHWRQRAAARPSSADQNAGDGMLWRIRATVADMPGRLAALCLALGELDVNIVAIHVRSNARGSEDAVVDEFVVMAPGDVTATEITGAIAAGGGRSTEVWPFDGQDLLDVPTPSWAAAPSPTDLSAPGSLAAARRTRL
jgi:hypothetical protein